MIKSFKCHQTERLFKRERVADFVNIEKVARRKLNMLNNSRDVTDLRVPPGNRLHELRDDRAGQWSISINDQFCVCFEFRDGDAYEVEIVDYH